MFAARATPVDCDSQSHSVYLIFFGALRAPQRISGTGCTGVENLNLGAYIGLTTLFLDANSFTSTVPSEIGHLVKAEHSHLDANELTGKLPTQLGRVRAISPLSIALAGRSALCHGPQPLGGAQ